MRRTFYWVIALLLCAGLIELSSWGIAAALLDGVAQLKRERTKAHDRGDFLEEVKDAATLADVRRAFAGRFGAEIAHPYFGYIFYKNDATHGFVSDDIVNKPRS